MANEYLKDGRFTHEDNDCTVIALAYALDVPYEQAHAICKSAGREEKQGFAIVPKVLFRNAVWDGIGRKFLITDGAFEHHKIGDVEYKFTYYGRCRKSTKSLAEKYNKGVYIVRVGGHAYTMKDGEILNQQNGRSNVSYFIKVEKI